MSHPARPAWAAVAALALLAGSDGKDAAPAPAKPALAMSAPVACRRIHGYDQFEELPDAAITSEEKLQVYYEPSGFKVDRQGKQYVAKFVQDGVIRPKGDKKVVWKKDKILEYEAKSDEPPARVYLTNSVGLKGLPPGDYVLTLTLHDGLRPGTTATETLDFRIVPGPPAPKDEPAPKAAPEPAPKGKGKSAPSRPGRP